MKEKVLRVGIVGCGEIAQVAHLPLLLELPNYEVTALCDLSEKVLNYLGAMYNVQNLFTDYQDLIKRNDVDIVLVTNRDHAPVAISAMNAGKHVFAEKPMCFNLSEADAIIEAEKANKVKFMVGYMKRYDPAFQYALPIIKEIDDVQLIKVHDFAGDYTMNQEIYDEVQGDDISEDLIKEANENERQKMIQAIGSDRADLIDAYSVLMYLLIHDSILLHEAYGKPTEVLFADVYNDTTVLAVLKYGDKTRCVIECGLLLDRREWDEHFVVYGKNKRVSIDFPFPYVKNVQTIVSINEQDQLDKNANMEKTVMVSFDEAFKREWRHFYECITEDKRPITNCEKGKADIELMINIIRSVKR